MFAYLEVVQGAWAAAPCSEAPVGCQGSQCQVGLASCPVSGVVTSSFPPAPFESCRFSLPTGDNTPPRGERDARCEGARERDRERQRDIPMKQNKLTAFLLLRPTITLYCVQISYPGVGRLVHVTLDFSSVRNKILHASIFKCSWIRGGEYGLHAARTHAQK